MLSIPLPVDIRFWHKVRLDDGDQCWLWAASVNRKGYGQFQFSPGRSINAQRVAFFLTRGHWPTQGLHTCDNPPCCNPAHIYDGTDIDNVRDKYERGRDWQSKVTHCPSGHAYDAANTWIKPSTGERVCRACRQAYKLQYRARKKALTDD